MKRNNVAKRFGIAGLCLATAVSAIGGFSLLNKNLAIAEDLTDIAPISLVTASENATVTYEDGAAVEEFWENQKNTLHIWLPHTAIQEIDYQLYEAVGYLYVRDFESAIPKLEILMGMCENIPQSYRFSWENIL